MAEAHPPTRWRRRWLAWLLVLGLILSPMAPAAERRLELTGFQLVAELARDGSLMVSETLTARFEGQWNGLRRELPVLARRPDGLEPLGLRLLSASDGAGHRYRTETRHQGQTMEWRIFVPGAIDATHTVLLRYRVRNGVRFYADHDELNWNVTGNAWEIPIDRVEARVRLPEGVRGLQAAVYTGPVGATGQDARLAIGPREVTAVSTRRLEPGEGLTLAVGFEKGLVTPRSAGQQALAWPRARLALLLPLLTALLLGPLWWRIGRDPALGAVPVVYEPPGDLPAAVLGSLVRQEVGSETLAATLVALAVRGHLRIEERGPVPGAWVEAKAYGFTLRTDRLRWSELAPHERYLLERLFPAGTVGASVDTEALRDSFYVHVPGFQALVREAVLAQGFYRRWPATVRLVTLLAGFGVAGAALALARALLPPDLWLLQTEADPVLTVGSLLATMVLILVFAWLMPRRTPRGAQVLRQTLGFQEFLRRVEAPRYRKVIRTPELFERCLPHAMVAGLTRQWTVAFAGIVTTPPSWYGGRDGRFDLGDFGSSLEACGRDTCSAMVSSPSGSGASGSSGGGSSGGGDGGGGGGGF